MRVVTVFIAGLFAFNALDLIDLGTHATSPFRIATSKATVLVDLILAMAFGKWLAMASWVDYRLNSEFGAGASNREVALRRNAVTIIIVVLALIFALSEIEPSFGPLVAFANVL